MADDRSPRYWQSLEARSGDAELRRRAEREFAEELPAGEARRDLPRRDFFKWMGLSAATFAAACSRAPVKKVVPYLEPPEDITPGVPVWYASSCGACPAGCGALIKARDGRPIKLEGNDAHPASAGGLCAVGQASVLSLYDAARARGPLAKGRAASWDAIDERVKAGLASAAAAGSAIRIVLPVSVGPTAEAAVRRLLDAFPTAKVVRHDPLGDVEALAEAHGATHGVRAVPLHHFDRARLIVSVGADFLGTWVSPVVFAAQYARGRRLRGEAMRPSRHVQIEPIMTLTGSNADERLISAPGEELAVLAALGRALSAGSGHPQEADIAAALAGVPAPELDAAALGRIAGELRRARGAALVVCGSADPAAQAAAAAVNELIGAYGATIEHGEPSALESHTVGFEAFLEELGRGEVGAALLAGVNPVYDHPRGPELGALLAKVPLTVTTSDRRDETSAFVELLAPDHHFLESWGDTAPRRGLLGLRQPGVLALHDTRSAWESILRWSGAPDRYEDFLRRRWEREIFARLEDPGLDFEDHWVRSVHDGYAEVPAPAGSGDPGAGAFRAAGLSAAIASRQPAAAPGELSAVLHAGVALHGGAPANNAWLQELPDPISKATWGNHAAVAPRLAASLGLATGALARVSVGERAITLPVLVQPGMHHRAVAIALGYGRKAAGPIGDGVGANAYPLARAARGRIERTAPGAQIAPAGGAVEIPLGQTHASLEGRPHVREMTLADLERGAGEAEERRHLTLWSGHPYDGHRWGMVVDLAACTGCSACVIACQAENNVAVVGPDEVRRGREMGWMRIDRYYTGDPERPAVVHQPMMCQHCENAPCETVCPVLATVHSTEGLNQQVYNRCVGTRYCANNCPPKVRRFNWFDYHGSGPAVHHDNPLARMVLNPDVVVRSRGVMEKCSMCVQRIQAGKAAARAEGRPLADGEIRTACEQSCPAQAIVFGDLNDPSSRIAALAKDRRSYRVLADINVEPVVRYMAKVRTPGSET